MQNVIETNEHVDLGERTGLMKPFDRVKEPLDCGTNHSRTWR
ncbi:MAG: hypothetical protein ACOX3K_05125 [Bacilli bacterium]